VLQTEEPLTQPVEYEVVSTGVLPAEPRRLPFQEERRRNRPTGSALTGACTTTREPRRRRPAADGTPLAAGRDRNEYVDPLDEQSRGRGNRSEWARSGRGAGREGLRFTAYTLGGSRSSRRRGLQCWRVAGERARARVSAARSLGDDGPQELVGVVGGGGVGGGWWGGVVWGCGGRGGGGGGGGVGCVCGVVGVCFCGGMIKDWRVR
jgi:hypothetical protein